MSTNAPLWLTRWQGASIVVLRDGVEIDRIDAADIVRVVMVQEGRVEAATEMAYAVVELTDEVVIFPAETGIAGRVHFERHEFWNARRCIWWVSRAAARLPGHLRRGSWLWRSRPGYVRLPKAELAACIDAWPLEGPQSLDERRWQRLERSRPFTAPMGLVDERPRKGAWSTR